MQKVGIIGGSGLYDLPGLQKLREVRLKTPFGEPSDAFITGELEGTPVVFVPRHGRGHRLLPSEINVRANIWGLKKLGVTRVLSVSAVGSMREEIVPGHLVVPDQFIDRTVARKNTFFGEGVVAHVPFATPICINLAGHLATAARTDKTNEVHVGGSYVCIEGPAFSTCAESLLYRSWDVSVIGMTSLPEAKLAREAELCYATLALATDYDCWHQGHESVTVEVVMNTMKANVERARQTIRAAAKVLGEAERACTCEHALAHAVMTAPESIPPKARVRLGLLLEKYLPATKAVRKPATKTIKSVKTTKTVRRVMG